MEQKNSTPNISDSGNGENRLRKLIIIILALFVIVGTAIGLIYLNTISKRVYVEKSEIDAPQVLLASKNGGVLTDLYVQEGDQVGANAVVAKVGDELIKSKDAGLVILVRNNIGQYFSPGENIITTITPNKLRLVGRLEEDKGLDKVKVGQRVIFTADAFGSKEYEGIVDEVSPASRASDVVFNISDQRQENEFNVKARFNISQYPELKNGMSAKMWIYK